MTGWLKGRNQRTNQEGLFPAGQFVKFIPSGSSVMRPRPVPKPRVRPPTSTTSGYLTKSEINDSGYAGSPRGNSVHNCSMIKKMNFCHILTG